MDMGGRGRAVKKWHELMYSYSYRRNRERMVSLGQKRKLTQKIGLCQWTDEQMTRAMEAVMKGELGVNHSALEHGVDIER